MMKFKEASLVKDYGIFSALILGILGAPWGKDGCLVGLFSTFGGRLEGGVASTFRKRVTAIVGKKLHPPGCDWNL